MKTSMMVCGVIAVVLLAGCSKNARAGRTSEIVEAIKAVDEGRAVTITTYTDETVADIKNADITWDGNTIGIFAKIDGASKEVLKKPADEVVPSLLEALKDKNRFVAAHAILSQKLKRTYAADAGYWNGLRVSIYADGKREIPDEQRAALVWLWADEPWMESPNNNEGAKVVGTNAAVAVAAIKNSDIEWDGSEVGLLPRIGGASKEFLKKPTNKLGPLLFAALRDEDRFVAAHVLLTKMAGYSKPIDASSWNGLRVALNAGGKADISAEQRGDLLRQWDGWRTIDVVDSEAETNSVLVK